MFPLPAPLRHHIPEGLFTTVPFTKYLMSCYKEKITRYRPKGKKALFEETEQASEPDVIGMLELKTTMITMLKALIHKVDSMQE